MDELIEYARICAMCSELHPMLERDEAEVVSRVFFKAWNQALQRTGAIQFYHMVEAEQSKIRVDDFGREQ